MQSENMTMLLGAPLLKRAHTPHLVEDPATAPRVREDPQALADYVKLLRAAPTLAPAPEEPEPELEPLRTTAEEYKLLESNPLLSHERATPEWRVWHPSAFRGAKDSYYVVSHYTHRVLKQLTNTEHPVWGSKIPWSAPHAVTVHWSEVVVPSWWEACKRFALVYRAIPRSECITVPEMVRLRVQQLLQL